jgi:hypothetical protein
MGDEVRVNQFVSKSEYRSGSLLRPRRRQCPKTSGKRGGKLPARVTFVSKKAKQAGEVRDRD